MNADLLHQRRVSVDDINSLVPELGSSRNDLLEEISSNGEVNGELGRAGEVLTGMELDLACSSEKFVNLRVLMMHVATMESEIESLASEKGHASADSIEKALEFDLLSGILDSEVGELGNFMATLQRDVVNAHDMISSLKHLGETYLEMEAKLRDSEESLKQSRDQVLEMRMQSAKFQRILSCLDGEGNWSGDQGANFSEDGQFLNMNSKIKMQTAEQQRHILRMLERSLAREMDLEKKLIESRQIEEDLRIRLLSSEQEAFCVEEEALDTCQRCFEAENAAEALMGTSKELLGRIQILQLNLNSSVQRESQLRSKLKDSVDELEARESYLQKLGSSSARLSDFLVAQTESLKISLKEADDKLILSNSEVFTLRDKVSSLEEQINEYEIQLLNAKVSAREGEEQNVALCSQISQLENVIEDLKEKVSKAESDVETVEAKCKLLSETNMLVNQELSLLKGSEATLEKMESLEKQLRESDIQLQHAVASAEASQEKQNMLCSTITDMENLIEDLKSKVLKAENRADSAEDKLIILSESNAELNEELNFLRGKLECLETSLHQAEETKMETAKDIGIRTKVITNLVMQLALERERLHQQISALSMEKNILVVKLRKRDKDPSVVTSHDNGENDKEFLFPGHDLSSAPCARESKEELANLSATSPELDEKKSDSVREMEVASPDSTSELENVRRLDAGMLNFKHIFIAMLVLLVSVAVYIFHQQDCPF